MNVLRGLAPSGGDIIRWAPHVGRWLLVSLILLFRRWVSFVFGTRSALIVGLISVGLFAGLDAYQGPQGSLFQQPAPDLYSTVLFELVIVALCVRLVASLRDRARRPGWIRFLAAWTVALMVYGLAVTVVPRLATSSAYVTGRFQISAVGGLVVALVAAGAIYNWRALAKILATARLDSKARVTRRRILGAVAKRPLPVPAGATYSLWYSWAACELSASPAATHRAAEAAVSALKSGADAAAAAAVARLVLWSPAGIIDRFRSTARTAAKTAAKTAV